MSTNPLPHSSYKTPRLTTASIAPLHLLEQTLLEKEKEIEHWFEEQWQHSPAPIYGSVDLRNSGFKLAPVDMNLFPAGFNNLNPAFLPLSIDAARIAITQHLPTAKSILIIPENHTRNLFYWDNITVLLYILSHAGFKVRLGSLLPEPMTIRLADNTEIQLEPITRDKKNNTLFIKNFIPDLILLNNDLSAGIPELLQHLQQPIIPPAELGWSQRLKSGHFQYYADVSHAFSDLLQIDPWLIAPLFLQCNEIDFMKNEGESCLEHHVEKLFSAIQKKYDHYQITSKPFVIIKADAGTYGMAVMTVRDPNELRLLNRKERTKMSKTKSGQPVHRVIIQEGIYTFETWDTPDAIAEPVVYLWGQRIVGGFYRVHKERGIDENLNAPGMHFEPLALSPTKDQNRFYAYGVIARLSMLAAARELLEQNQK